MKVKHDAVKKKKQKQPLMIQRRVSSVANANDATVQLRQRLGSRDEF